jgi:two-component system, NtrC family, response regulator HydG
MSLPLFPTADRPLLAPGVLVVDAGKRILYADDAAAQLLGISAGDLIGSDCSAFSSILPCADGVCSLETPCRFLEHGGTEEVGIRTNDRCTFESVIARDGCGERIGTIHLVTFPKPELPKVVTEVARDGGFSGMIGSDPAMKKLFELTALVAATDVTVHIFGPSGAGKELVAEAVHRLSVRSEKRLVKINCSTIPVTLLESALFGHAKGAFTGAGKDNEGYVEYAEGGTLFLDEIGDVSLDVQVKLLRLLESREFSRVGETRTRFADIRIVTATNQDLRALVDQKRIREDFFYRIHVFPLVVPPLKDRADDIPVLAQYFVEKFRKTLRKNITGVSDDGLRMLARYNWPGNVRELQHAIEHAFVKAANGYLLPEHFPPLGAKVEPTHASSRTPAIESGRAAATLDEAAIRRELLSASGNASLAAKRLGVSRVTLWKYMKRLGIDRG